MMVFMVQTIEVSLICPKDIIIRIEYFENYINNILRLEWYQNGSYDLVPQMPSQ